MATGLHAVNVADKYLNWLVKATSAAAPTGVFVKLHLGDPGSAGTSNPATETTRKSVSFGTPSAGAVSSNADVSWTSYPAAETVTHVSLWDNVSAGNFLFSDQLNSSCAMQVGNTLTIQSGQIALSFTVAA